MNLKFRRTESQPRGKVDASTVAAKNAGSAVVTNGASGQDREVSVGQFLLPIGRGSWRYWGLDDGTMEIGDSRGETGTEISLRAAGLRGISRSITF